jgi:hypothetical protein
MGAFRVPARIRRQRRWPLLKRGRHKHVREMLVEEICLVRHLGLDLQRSKEERRH